MFARPAPARSGREALLRKKDRDGPGLQALAASPLNAQPRALGYRAARDAGGRSGTAARFGCRTGRRMRSVLKRGLQAIAWKFSDGQGGDRRRKPGGPARRKRKAERLERVAKGALERIKLDAIAEIEKTFAWILGKRNGASRGRPPDRASGGQASATNPQDAREGRCAFYIIERIRKRSEAAR